MVAELLPTSNWEGAVGSGPIKKTQGKMRSHDLGRKDSQRKMKEKVKGKGNLPGLVGMGAVGMAETGAVGTVEIGAVGSAETSVEGVVGIDLHGRSRHPYVCCNSWPLKSLCKWGDRHTNEREQ